MHCWWKAIRGPALTSALMSSTGLRSAENGVAALAAYPDEGSRWPGRRGLPVEAGFALGPDGCGEKIDLDPGVRGVAWLEC